MFRKAKSFVKKITLLTDPEPTFVSLVSGGANKSPFRSIKSELEDDAMTILNSKKSDQLEFHSVIFKGESFKSVEACKAWLSDGDIAEDQYDISEEATGFIASSKAEFITETLEQVDYSDLTVIYGKMADSSTESLEAAGDVVVVAGIAVKSDEVAPDAPVSVSKFDAYDAVYSNGTTIEEVVTDASRWSGIPIGFYELNVVLTTALDHALRDGADTAVIRQIVSDYADRLVLLAEASKGIPSAERQALFDAFGNRVKAEEASEPVAEKVDETEEIPAEIEAVEAEEAPVEVEAEEDSAHAAEVQAVEEAAAVSKSDELAEIRAFLVSISETIGVMNSSIKLDREEMGKLAGRVERFENAGQTRKSATPDESVQVKKTASSEKVGGLGMAAFKKN